MVDIRWARNIARSCSNVTDLEEVFLPVDNDGGDLLIHEDEDGADDGGETGSQSQPPRVLLRDRVDEPASV